MHDGPRAQKRPLPETRPEASVWGRRAAGWGSHGRLRGCPGPLLSTPSLADTIADLVDDRAVQILLQLALKRRWRRRRRRRGSRRRCWRSTARSVLTCRSRTPSGRHGGHGVASAPPPLVGRRGRGRRGGCANFPNPLPQVADVPVFFSDKFQQSNVLTVSLHQFIDDFWTFLLCNRDRCVVRWT